jgi:hypothetical protein
MHISTSQTCDYPIMSTDSNPNETGSPLNTIPFVINGIPSNSFIHDGWSVEDSRPYCCPACGFYLTHRQRTLLSLFLVCQDTTLQSIPLVSNPFSFGMPNMMSQLSSSIPTTNANPSFGPRVMAPPHAPLSFGGGHIPQTNPTVGGQPPFSSRSNPSLNAPRWSTQLSKHVTSHIPSFPPLPSMPILTNSFFMKNPSLSSGVPPRGSHFHTLGNPHPRAPPAGGSVYNPHYTSSTGMVPIQPFMK